jgi:hypothetical protein
VKLQVSPLQLKLKIELGGAFEPDDVTVTDWVTLPVAPPLSVTF